MQHPGTAGAYVVHPAAGIMDHGSLVIEVPSASPCEQKTFSTTKSRRHEEHLISQVPFCAGRLCLMQNTFAVRQVADKLFCIFHS